MTGVRPRDITSMRAVLPGTLVLLAAAAVVTACAHDEAKKVETPQVPEQHASSKESGPPQYLIADPSPRGGGVTLALGSAGTFGLVVDKSRVVVGRGEPRVAVDTTDETIIGARKLPTRFGGGYLFWTERSLYRADQFDAPLKPVARVPDAIARGNDFQSVSFASKFVLVRTNNGERWAIGMPNGERKTIEPLNVADVEALDDGRALAFNDQGAAFASTDGGDHWADITAQIRSSPSHVNVIENEIWLIESAGGALRLELDGHLSAFDKPPADKTPEIRARDPKWRGQDAPLRSAFRSGAAVDDSNAVVIEDGDLVHVDVRTGEVTSVVTGKLPPDAHCEAVPVSGDVLFACVSRGSMGSAGAFVVSHTIVGDSPVIEQSFGVNAQFYASDDGGLAFAGPCGGSAPPPSGGYAPSPSSQDNTVCVRQPGGSWQEQDTSALQNDGGPGDVRVLRWIPRSDGRVVAFIYDSTPGIYDPHTGNIIALGDEAREIVMQGYTGGGGTRYKKHAYYRGDSPMIDSSWSFAANGALRGWQRHGGIVEVTDDGRLNKSPYAFDVLAAGQYALGRTKEGRLYQSSDHGATWVEVAGPPSGAGAVEMRSCTTAGCDLGAFYRVGWQVRAPRIDPAPTTAAPAAEVRRTRGLELSCRPIGVAPATKILPRTGSSPEDLGLGASRLPVAGESSTYGYLRTPLPRTIVNPLHENGGGDGGEGASLRAMLSGFQTTRDSDVIEVMGPNKNAASLRRQVSYVAAFDPAATVRRATIAMSDVIAVGRGAGLTNDEILSDDMTETGNLLVVTPVDGNAPSDLAFANPRGLVALIKGERTKLAMRNYTNNEATLISGASLGADEAAFLELETSGVGHVFKIAGGGTTDLFDISPTVNDAAYYPANPDAVAVGPKNEIGVIRTASGSDPASTWDPAIVIVPAMPPVALAPWSKLEFGDSPACKEPGWRATLQIIAPWVKVTTPELRIDESPMIARVKWNEKRVCLEGFEAKMSNVNLRVTGGDRSAEPLALSTWLVAKGSTFMRVGVADGVEWRQPLECTVVPNANAQASATP
jgi:hypothetical protein